MIDIMNTLLKYLWLLDFATLCIFTTIAVKQQQNSSSFITQALVVIMSGTIIKYQGLINSFVSPATDQSTLVLWLIGFVLFDAIIILGFYLMYRWFKKHMPPAMRIAYITLSTLLMSIIVYTQYAPLLFDVVGPSFKVWCMTAFYIGVALLDVFVVFVIYKLHLHYKKTHTLIARMYILAFVVAATIQMLRFNEKLLLESEQFKSLYQLSLASINVCTSAIAFVIACLAVYQFNSNKKRKGFVWTI